MGDHFSSIKPERDESRLFNARAMVAGVFILFALLGVLARLYFLQFDQYGKYAELSREHYQKRIPIPPNRGQIYDRNGVLLADSTPQYVLEVVRDDIGDENKDGKVDLEDVDGLLARLGKLVVLSEADIRVFKQQVGRFKYQPVPLKDDLSAAEIAAFAVNRPRFPGVNLEMRMERHYPLGETASHVLGYVGRIDDNDLEHLNKNEYTGTAYIGKSGIEAFHESRLHGQAGYDLYEVDAFGKRQSLLEQKAPVGGQDLFLGIDIKLQKTAENLLAGEKGAIVAIDPRNGEVLALASVPMFDPNKFINGISAQDYASLRDDPKRPMYNRALQGIYPPGSTVKPMAGLAGLAAGAITAGTRVNDPGYFRLPGQQHVFRCWNKRGHGTVDLKVAIAQSCDVFFYTMAYHMGIDKFSAAMRGFGFGEQTGIDLPSESTGLMPTQEWKQKRHKGNWYPGDTVNVGIGQGFWLATPLQLAHAVSVIANHGVRLKPHLLRGVRTNKNQEESVLKPEPFPSVQADPKQWDLVINGMENVMQPGGTARAAGAGAAYRIAGKTGTAQVHGLNGGKYSAARKEWRDHALFVGFAPADDPQIAVSVIMENAPGSGGHVAAPIGRQVMDAYLLKKYDDGSPAGVADAKKPEGGSDPHD